MLKRIVFTIMLTVTDYNKFAQDETAKELVNKVTQSLAKSEQDSVVLESKTFCQMHDSLLSSKGWLKVMERMGIDNMFELYPTYKTGLIQSIESSSELWKSNCIN